MSSEENDPILIVDAAKTIAGSIWPVEPLQRWYVCNRCGAFYQSIWGCGCAIELILKAQAAKEVSHE